jgi:hypothetical protein
MSREANGTANTVHVLETQKRKKLADDFLNF